jgi:hypothetical protein
MKEYFAGGRFATRTGFLELWERGAFNRRNNPEQVFRPGGDWHGPENGQNYLNPPLPDHCLALACIHQGNHQEKQDDGRGKNENLIGH